MDMKSKGTFLIVTITVFVSLLIPALVQEGMFLDGVTYSAISKNLVNGYGSYWNPHYTYIVYPSFYEHPPLVLIIQSFFFQIFGNGFITERIFCLFIAILTVIGIIQCWRILADKPEWKEFYWLPVLLWLMVPLVSWSYKNNILENTMGVFTVFASFCIIKALKESRVLFVFPGGILIIMAFLSKGFAGVFPVAIPLLYGLVYKTKKRAVLYFVYLILFIVSFSFIIVILFPEVKENITQYFNQQLLPALRSQREITTNNRFSLIFDLIMELAIPLVVVIFCVIFIWRKSRNLTFFKNKPSLLYLLIAITASLPLIISFKQRELYLVPSIPFYTLAFGFLIVAYLKVKLDKISEEMLKILKSVSFAVLLIVLIISIMKFGKFSRDEEKLKDVYAISKYIPEGTIIDMPEYLYSDWSLVAYMCRVGNISLDIYKKHEYFLMEKDSKTTPPVEFVKVDLKLEKYIILKRRTGNNPVIKK